MQGQGIDLCNCCIAALIAQAIVQLQHLLIFNLKHAPDTGAHYRQRYQYGSC